jgi:hypothetical protein
MVLGIFFYKIMDPQQKFLKKHQAPSLARFSTCMHFCFEVNGSANAAASTVTSLFVSTRFTGMSDREIVW